MSVEDERGPEDAPAPAVAATSPPKKRKASLNEIEVDLSQPEPPSKKARRAQKKGKAPGQSTDANDDKKAGEKGQKSASAHGVWVGNLPFTTTKAELRRWLVDNSGGVITEDSITRVHMPMSKDRGRRQQQQQQQQQHGDGGADDDAPDRPSGAAQSKGFAYVDFATYDAAVAAIALSETSLGPRSLLIKASDNFEGRPAPPPREAEPPAVAGGKGGTGRRDGPAAAGAGAAGATKVFVGNLSYAVTEDDLRAHFEKCGEIRWVKVATFEDSGKCKGYAWVNFREPEAAQWAVKGFVKIRETVDTLEDFVEEDEEGDGGDKDGEEKAAGKLEPVRKTKIRKWWVNQLHGRPLKTELAEDDQTRYKKRFGKGAAGPRQEGGDGGGGKRQRQDDADGQGEVRESRPVNFHEDISVARLTGAAVKPQGKKVTFD